LGGFHDVFIFDTPSGLPNSLEPGRPSDQTSGQSGNELSVFVRCLRRGSVLDLIGFILHHSLIDLVAAKVESRNSSCGCRLRFVSLIVSMNFEGWTEFQYRNEATTAWDDIDREARIHRIAGRGILGESNLQLC